MGGSNSHHSPQHYYENPPTPVSVEQPFMMDLNSIVKGIPKMMQVADDMHRMTDYLGDLRNMTLAMGVMSAIGIILFLVLKYVQSSRKRRSRQRLYQQSGDYSDHSSLNRPIRQYAQKDIAGWITPVHKIDIDHHDNQAPPPPPKPVRDTPDFATPAATQPNGHMVKTRYDPVVKLVVDDLPYADDLS